MARTKKKISFDEPVLLELQEIAKKTGKHFSDIVNEAVLLGIDGVRKKYADRLKEKDEEKKQENEEENISDFEKWRRERWKRILTDYENAEYYGWERVM